ncbi:DAPG hydrolase family protein [Maribacter sp. 2307UL18-2]|uniref:DAPG hydrolase family protein n=1 Tax=Maribacter sp. 2307UL18-2 TaxID=3386274 RepID=UPI0039BC5543
MGKFILKHSVGVFALLLLGSCSLGKEADPSDYPVGLSSQEKEHPLSKYYYNHKRVSDKRIAGLMYHEPEAGLAFEDINEMLEPGYLPLENGYTKLKDGTGYVATNIQFPKTTGKMIDWWFEWVGYDVMRYKIWYPGLHASALYENYEEPETFSISKYVLANPEGKTKHTIEAMVKDGPLQDLQITFVNPEQYGLDISKLGKDQWAICGNVKSGNRLVVQMVHFVRNTPDGVEMRSRFWVGKDLPWILRKLGVKNQALYDLAHHCLTEYTQLASFLPEVYNMYATDLGRYENAVLTQGTRSE